MTDRLTFTIALADEAATAALMADLALLIAYAEGLNRPDSRAVEIAVREASLDPIGV